MFIKSTNLPIRPDLLLKPNLLTKLNNFLVISSLHSASPLTANKIAITCLQYCFVLTCELVGWIDRHCRLLSPSILASHSVSTADKWILLLTPKFFILHIKGLILLILQEMRLSKITHNTVNIYSVIIC